ncbi:MAG: hypothetical protein ACQETJ_12470, partial [Bacteroidota bacterium]
NLVFLGAVEMPGARSFDTWLLKLNENGDTLNTRVLDSPGNDVPFRIVSNGPNGYLLATVQLSPEKGFVSRLISVDSSFTQKWLMDSEQSSALLQTDVTVDNAGNIWWLNTFTGINEKPRVSLWKLDSEGEKISEFSFDDGLPANGYAIGMLPDGMIGITSQIQPIEGHPTVQVLKVDTDGKLLWKSLVPQSGKILTPLCICCSPDNSLLVGGWAGLCYNPDAPEEEQIWDYDYLLTKLDANGKILWTQNYNREGSEKGSALAVLPDGSIMAAGNCETSFTGNIGPWLLFVDKNGKLINDQVYKFKFNHDRVACIINTSDGGFLMVGPGYIDTEHRLTGWVKKLSPVL